MADDAPMTDARWVSFREGAGTSFGAALPVSLPVGRGWRGGYVRGIESIEALDALVLQITDRAGASLGMWQTDGFSYGIAAARGDVAIPFVLDVDPSYAPDAAAEAIARCQVGSSVAGWRQHAAQALSAWSVHAPTSLDPLEIDAALQIAGSDIDAVETWCRMLGMAVPVPREPDADDEAAQVRAALTFAAERRRLRRSAETSW